MTTLLLIRHGANDLLGHRIAGRMPGVHLNAEGHRQAERLAERLDGLPIRAVYSGPLERARETAAPLAARLGLDVIILDAIGEIDFGHWTGESTEALYNLPRWQRFNAYRSGIRIPNGETMLEAQCRAVNAIERLQEEHPEDLVAIVSHGDVVKAALAYFLGVPLDLFRRIEVDPGSLSIVELADWGPRIVLMNDTGEPLAGHSR
jgi:probable phosphomutase (TIGR03848 family)